MLGKILLPLLYPLAAALVPYLKAKHRWIWDHINILGTSAEADTSFKKEAKRIALDGVRGSAQMTFFIYVAVWSPELVQIWRSHPTLTILTIIVLAGLLDLSPRRQMPAQN